MNRPYSAGEPHPYIASSDKFDGKDAYCLVCGSYGELRDNPKHIEAEPHEYIVAERYGLLQGKFPRCFVCGERRINVMHPSEQMYECGAQVNLDVIPARSASRISVLAPVRCGVDSESFPTHMHYAAVQAFTPDAHPVTVTVTWL